MAVSSHQLSAVPLFPLPNMVMFPRAVQLLHIFEERYKAMTAHCLAGQRLLAMALPKPGWEKDYYGRPDIEPIVCVGTILTHELLPEGKYNFLLQGHTRARIVREHEHQTFRLAELEPIIETPASEEDLLEYRDRMISVFDSGTLLATVIGRQFRQLLSSALPTSEIADLIAFNFLNDVLLKQSLLAEGDVRLRVARTVAEFEAVRPALQPASSSPHKPNLN